MSADRLFDLMPAVHRLRDAAQGDPLRALLSVIAGEVSALEQNIGQLYDDAFIETCSEWVVPYLGDLLGARPLLPVDDPAFTQRGYVAGRLDYQRRKGTASVLAQLARDLTGWPAVVVELFQRLATTQHVNHVRLGAPATADLRDGYRLQFVDTPFEQVAHLADVRHVDTGRGRYNIPNVGLFLFRLQGYPLSGVTARALDQTRFTVDPLGRSQAVFTVPDTAGTATYGIGPENVTMALSRRTMRRDPARYYGTDEDPASIVVAVDGTVQPLGSVDVCDLSDTAGGWAHQPVGDRIAVDPQLGRIAFGTPPAGAVTTSYAYGFPGDLGGGPYDKRAALARYLGEVGWQAGVMAAPPPDEPRIKPTLQAAVAEWNQQPPGTHGVIVLLESGTRTEDLDTPAGRIAIPEGSHLVVVSGQWPLEEGEDPTQPPVRRLGRVSPRAVRAHLRGTIEVVGTAPSGSPEPGRLTVLGVLLEGALTVRAGRLGGLTVSHCSLVPGTTTLQAESNPGLAITLERSVVGDLSPADPTVDVSVTDCVVAGDLSADTLAVESSTLLGSVAARSASASNSIFVGPVSVVRRQVGCFRYSYVSLDSRTPRRFRCQPADTDSAGRVRPAFASMAFGAPDYALLHPSVAPEIGAGGEGETELGAWRFLQVPRRLRNLRTALDEYLRFGLEAGVFAADQQGRAGGGA
ncbi:hypothetical protein [Intrasporangium sp.]|uniref:hypothetical protein n=1 Tax=Intrasporangium sp. TaxID=1925024 RepID=UPI0032217E9A